MSKIIIALTKDNYNILKGYRVFHLDNHYVEDVGMEYSLDEALNFTKENNVIKGLYDDTSNYPVMNLRKRIRTNGENKLLWFKEDNSIILIDWQGNVEDVQDSDVLKLAKRRDVLQKSCIKELIQGMQEASAALSYEMMQEASEALSYEMMDEESDETKSEKIVPMKSKEDRMFAQMVEESLIRANDYTEEKYEIVQTYEHMLSIRMNRQQITNIKDLNESWYKQLVDCKMYFYDLGAGWCKSRLNKVLSELERIQFKDGNTLIKFTTSNSFKTKSSIIRGSRHNNIYVLLDGKDNIRYVHTSYKDIENILEDVIELSNIENGESHKYINILLRNVHIENPQFDIERIGVGVQKLTGNLELIAEIREMNKVSHFRLCNIQDYDKYMSWLDNIELQDDEDDTYNKIVRLVENKVRYNSYDEDYLYEQINN